VSSLSRAHLAVDERVTRGRAALDPATRAAVVARLTSDEVKKVRAISLGQ
jgi:hypothetical protein